MTYEIEEVEIASTWIAAVRRRVAWAELGRVIPELLGQVQAWLGTLGERAQAGPGVAVYHQPGAEDVELECGVQIAAPVPGAPAPIRCGRAPAGRALRVRHRGPASELGRAHGALAGACRQRGYPAGVHWEVYGDRADPAAELSAEVYGSIDPNAAQLEYWNGPPAIGGRRRGR